jgi:hypothetical protein
MAGLLFLCLMLMALISVVNAVLWGTATASPWRYRVVLVGLAVITCALIFQLALYASDPAQSTMRLVGLVLFPLSVVGCYALNQRALRRYENATSCARN